ncbi:MAG: hypothetical protein KBT88_10370 [Gammaproteobacteria bacterium]|nr:hypothetical protein [Gammaproteobacteria bacterium]MBQ0840179.1 hypothetical protein [Gammaproteobacteria bacterium]
MIKNLFTASLALITLSANATLIDFTATGVGNIPNGWNEALDPNNFISDPAANFFQVKFTEGQLGESITRLSFDLRADGGTQAYFDPSDGNTAADDNDNSGASGKGFGPIIGDQTVGLLKTEVDFSLDHNSQIHHILDITFNLGEFLVGDILSFGIDIDMLGGQLSDIGGGLIGARAVGVSAITSGGCSSTTTFTKDSTYNKSSAQLCSPQSTTANVPLPSSNLLFIAGLLALQQSKKRLTLKETINVPA